MKPKPPVKPQRPFFSSGPTAKFPGWQASALASALVGRSHRSREGLGRLKDLLARMKRLLQVPEAYEIALVPASATGAVESALWNFAGTRPLDAIAFDVFGARWQELLRDQLRIPGQRFLGNVRSGLPDFATVDFDHDVLFTWNGSTSGLRMPDGHWIPQDRRGLTLCDATSGIFTQVLPWDKLDVTAFSWQKGLGGEAAHGMLILGPRALAHLEQTKAVWPTPCLFSLRHQGGVNHPLFQGVTLNTPSLLCVEDALLAVQWAEDLGGLPSLIQRTEKNADLVLKWCQSHPWIRPLQPDPSTRSLSTLCLELVPPAPLSEQDLWQQLRRLRDLLEDEKAGYDFLNHDKAVPCLRLWCGPTVEAEDLQAFLPWLAYAYEQVFDSHSQNS